MKIVSIDKHANIANITYAPKPNNTKKISEIHAPNGPPKFKTSWSEENDENPGSKELYETSAIKIINIEQLKKAREKND